jgi:phenylacetate-CoA ligase
VPIYIRLASQCPENNYHVSPNLLLEVLNSDGKPCKANEIGELVITDLHNFASPIIRYAIGDCAMVGEKCSCGRTLPTLKKIMGRNRNMAVYPDGSRRWPRVGFNLYRDVAPIVQYQLIQHDIRQIEVRLVSESTLTPQQENQLTEIIQNALQYPFTLHFSYFENNIPRGKGGKFEEFICRVSN